MERERVRYVPSIEGETTYVLSVNHKDKTIIINKLKFPVTLITCNHCITYKRERLKDLHEYKNELEKKGYLLL